MQALEKIGVLEQDEEKGGRRITQSGRRDLDREFFYTTFCTSGAWGQCLGGWKIWWWWCMFGSVRTLLTFFGDGIGIAQTTIEEDNEDEEEE